MKKRFYITYETVTESSATHGDFAHHGYLPKSKEVPIYRDNLPKNPALFTLRDAIELIANPGINPCEADSSPCDIPRWISAIVSEHWEPAQIMLAVHLENVVSDASARRIARLFEIRVK